MKKKPTRRDKSVWLALGLALLTLVGAANYLAGSQLSLTIFYLVPVLLLSWYVGFWAGALAVALTALDWFAEASWNYPEGWGWISLWNAILELGLFFVVIYLATSLKQALEREKRYARTDHRTGALNARAFEELANQEISRCQRYEKPLTAVFLDVDDFKAVNDRFGHAVGDAVLRTLSDTVKGNIRASDVMARLGGDEFMVLLPECGEEPAPAVLSRLADRLRESMRRNRWPVTLSIGAVTFLRAPSDYEELVHRTDTLMYEAKRGGKDLLRHEVVRPDAAHSPGAGRQTAAESS